MDFFDFFVTFEKIWRKMVTLIKKEGLLWI